MAVIQLHLLVLDPFSNHVTNGIIVVRRLIVKDVRLVVYYFPDAMLDNTDSRPEIILPVLDVFVTVNWQLTAVRLRALSSTESR